MLSMPVSMHLVAVCGRGLVRAVKEHGFVLFDLIVYETCNAFWKEHIKFHRISREDAIRACTASKALARYARLYSIADLEVEEVMKIAVENNTTFYDSSYIALARQLGAPIASEDRDIIAVAPKYGLKTIRLRSLMGLVESC